MFAVRPSLYVWIKVPHGFAVNTNPFLLHNLSLRLCGTGIWQILLDFSGGLLSDLQLVGDCFDLMDWTGLTGNLAKFFLGFVSILFDTVFMLQHYVWYPESGRSLTAVGEMYDADNNDHVEPETSPML